MWLKKVLRPIGTHAYICDLENEDIPSHILSKICSEVEETTFDYTLESFWIEVCNGEFRLHCHVTDYHNCAGYYKVMEIEEIV